MKKTLIIIGAILILLVGGLLIAPAFIPAETYKAEILAQIEKATGRKARIDGAFRIALLPRVEFTAGKVSLANAPGGKAANMLSLDKLDVRVAVFPLLSGNIQIDSFVLDKPVINLEVDRQGRPNWQFGAAPAPAKGAPAPAAGGGAALPAGVKLGDVRLVGGLVTYSDAASGTSQRVEDINMSVSLPSLSSPMKADGSLVWNKEKLSLKLGLSNPNAFLSGRTTDVNVALASAPVNLGFKGKASGGKAVKASGALDLDVPSVRKLAAWAGSPIKQPGNSFGPLKITGTVAVDGAKYAFTGAKLALDKLTAQGALAVDMGGRKPVIDAKLDTGVLDLNPYLPPEAPASKAPAKAQPAQQGWSDAPIDLSGLKAADADLALKVGGLVMRKIKVGASAVKLALKNGLLVTELTEMALYKGKGSARLTANGAARVPAITADFTLTGLEAQPFLADAIAMERLEGTANMNMAVRTTGASQRALISALGGTGKVTFLNGAIRGINLGAMVRNISSAFLDPKAREQQKTDFAELSGSFTITNGIVRNDDLALLSPLLRVAGKGTVDLPKQTVNYRVEPKLVATTTGQGGTTEAAGIKVPVIISGPWSDLSYKPDLGAAIGGIAKEPEKALEGLKGMVPGLGGGTSGGTSGGTGGGTGSGTPLDQLKGLFGR